MKRALLPVLVVLLAASCSRGGGDESARGDDLLTPRFQPETTTTVAGSKGGPGSSSTVPGGATPTTSGGAGAAPGGAATPTTVGGQAPPPSTPPGVTGAAVTDRRGDLTPSPADPPPAWADLVGGTLLRRADGFELRVRLGGGAAPTSTDEDHTMNIASFYDVDGDGDPDYEVWANLASGGWGSSWFDNAKRGGRFGDKAGVAIAVEGDQLVLRFPLSHIGGAERFRWSLASEWGRYEVLGTDATARDDAPDFDAAARFPG